MKKILSLTLFSLMFTGCATQSYILEPQGAIDKEADYSKSQSFVFSGISQKKSIDVAEVCNGSENVSKVETKQSFMNGLLGTITLGIYTPRDIEVYCK